MRFTSQEEYGLRCLVQMAREPARLWTIGDIAEREGLTRAYVAKLLAALGRAGLISATRGRAGGYRLARAPGEIDLAAALDALDARLYEEDFCQRFPGTQKVCVHDTDCAIRGLWRALDGAVHATLARTRLTDLIGPRHHPRVAAAPPAAAGAGA